MGKRWFFAGFTLMEISITVVVIGILATMALPKYFLLAEKFRVAEAKTILSDLRDAQVRYRTQENHFTNVLSDLDTQPSGMKYFTPDISVTLTSEVAALLPTTVVARCLRTPVNNVNGYPAPYEVNINQQGMITSPDANVRAKLL